MKDKIGVAVIGCGWIAQQHLKGIAADKRLEAVAVVDINEERAGTVAKEFGVRKFYPDWKDALNDKEIAAVIICLPHNLHAEVTIAAAGKGIHVLVEKPMAISLKEVDSMIAAADSNGVTLMVGQVLRKWTVYKKAKEMITAGRIGTPCRVIRRRLMASRPDKYPDNLPWARDPAKSGGWLLYGYGAHEIDLLLWLFNTHAVEMYALGAKVNPIWNDFDEITIDMRLANGVVCTGIFSMNVPVPAWDCSIIGTKGSMHIADAKIILGTEERIDVNDNAWTTATMEQMEEFATSIVKKCEPDASGRSVRKTMAALEAARTSLNEGSIVDASAL